MQHSSRFESLGVELPNRRVSSAELIESCRHHPQVDLEQLTGIRERRFCSEGEDSFTLAVDAAWDCLAHSRHDPGKIEMLISCSITKYKGGLSYSFEPPLSLSIKEAICASQALSFDVSNACAGMMTGVSILDDFIRRGVVGCGMVVSGEFISSISENATREVETLLSPELASLTVGDAGAAVILERAEGSNGGISACELVTVAEHSDLCIGKACSKGPGAAMVTNARRLHAIAIKAAVPTIEQALARSGVSLGEIDHVIPHQTSVRAIRSGVKHTEREIGETMRNVVTNLEQLGNTASTTHFVTLYQLLKDGKLAAGDRVLLLCYASGLAIGAVVFTMDHLVESYGRTH